MLRRKSKGARRTRIIIGLLLMMLLASVAMLFGLKAHQEQRRKLESLARGANEAVRQRATVIQQQTQTARETLPADAPISRDWTLQDTADACKPLLETDLALLQTIAREALARAPADKQREYENVQTRAQNAATTGTATPFEQDVAQHADSQDDMLRIACAYLAAFAPLREAEQALDRGLFTVPKMDDVFWNLPLILGDLAALRAFGELQDGDARRALQSTLHAYAFQQAYTTSKWFGYEFGNYVRHCNQCDFVLERIVDALFRDAPLSSEERERIIAVVGWRPSREQMIQDLYVFAAKDPKEVLGNTSKAMPFGIQLPPIVQGPLRNRGIYEAIKNAEPLIGRPPYEVARQFDNLPTKAPAFADFTQHVLWVAHDISRSWGERAGREELMRMAFALKDYRRAHGQYPAKLEESGTDSLPPVPRVPENGLHYDYASDGKSFTFSYTSQTRNKTHVAYEARE